MTQTTYYKVLGPNGESVNGGSLDWSLPTVDGGVVTPGAWAKVTSKIELCERGLHLTSAPAVWWQKGFRVFEAEVDPSAKIDGPQVREGDKIAVSKCRLLREVQDLSTVQIFSTGTHFVRAGQSHAFDSVTVTAFGSATVTACDSATVEASDSVTVRAFDSTTVIQTVYHGKRFVPVLTHNAVCIDRRPESSGGKPIIRVAGVETAP